jgi:release factor glutamine methyltransferase
MGRGATGSTSAGSVADALGSATDALAAAGVAEPRFDAEVLLAEATGRERARIAAEPGAGVAPAAAREFGVMVRRRIRREPVAYIVGRKGFRRIELEVDPRVLVPRPETEHLVEATLELSPSRVLEIGTGSGAVALALADELPAVEVWAADTSPAALAVARANAERLGLAGRVRFIAGTVPGEEFDVTVANLPYVSEREWGTLEPEVRDWEPREALLAGPDGLDAFREVIPLVSSPAVVLEVGAGQAEAVAELVRSAGYERIETRHDLAGIERVVLGRR